MANYIEMAATSAIVGLYEQGWSKSRIARELGIHRETVARYVRLARQGDSKPSELPTGSGADGGPKPSILPPGDSGARPGRRARCEPWRASIVAGIEAGLSTQRIWQDLVGEGFEGGYDSVKRYVRRLNVGSPERVQRMESPPGEEAQVDFGRGAPVQEDNGPRRSTWVLRITLSSSRKSYSQAVWRQDTESFIRCLENAFRSFGGVPQTLCIDNLKAAVQQADWYDPQLNPKVESFCRHYGTVMMPTRPYSPRHKGKIEAGIKYVKNNALKGRVFSTLREQNEFLAHWERTVADLRIHGTTRKQVRTVFLEQEKPALKPLPPMLFPMFREARRRVHSDSYVAVDNAYYEVPVEYIGRDVWVRWDPRTVRIYNERFEQIALLARNAPGSFSGCLSTGGRSERVEHAMAYWVRRALRLGDGCGRWAEEVVQRRGPAAIRVLQGLVQMSRKHSSEAINRACEGAATLGAWRLRDLRRLIVEPARHEQFAFMDSHPIIRDMAEYRAFLDTWHPDPIGLQRKENALP